ncbi:MAG TPA: FeoA family protein [Chitinophagales bacterium]|nr:FeoA family protein [Chitinophagales bacterium]
MGRAKNITHLKEGESAVIGEFSNYHIASKLMAMGLLPGSSISLQRSAPFGGAYYIKANNHYVALRSEEAKSVCLISKE